MADETFGGDQLRYDWEGEPDLTALSEEGLRLRLRELAGEEKDLSYRRRVLQGRIDLIRAELVRRGGAALSPEELARVLMDGAGENFGGERPGGRGS